jgi:excisionase family DNA binding protein
MSKPRGYVDAGALVDGWPAHFLSSGRVRRLIELELEDLPPVPAELVRETLEACRLAGEAWAERVRARKSEGQNAEAGGDLQHEPDEMIDAQEAAHMLDITSRRVRQLAAVGEIPGRKHGAQWRFSRADVAAYRVKGER